MSTKTKNIIIWSCFSAIFILVAILGTIYDLQISKALADISTGQYFTKNLFAIIGETIGENILYVLLVFSFGVLFFYLLKNPLNKKWLNLCLLIAMCFASVVICFYCLYNSLEHLSTHTNNSLDTFLSSTFGLISLLLFSIMVVGCAFVLISKIKKENINYLWKWALLVIVLSALSNGIVQGAKLVFDRTRYRAMVFSGDTDFQYYDYWFVFNKNKFSSVSPYAEDFFKSFPSGHTCAAASSFFLILLPLFHPQTNNKKWKTIFWTFATSYTLLIALSRIVAGAHFFMDTFIGAFITIILTIIAYYLVKYFQNKQINKENLSIKRESRHGC
ncbi:MAG: phosphatase PAP2 family protein [Clostridia bacterium]|nr:phosphatase PAP2 family protein [Clostridia bacterium]